MKKIVVIAFLAGGCFVSSVSANADDCPSGQHYFSGRCAVTPATTYAGCLRNGRAMGYAAAQAEAYCRQRFPH